MPIPTKGVQRRFGNRAIVRRGVEHWLAGLVRHACGRRMHAQGRPAPDPGRVSGDDHCQTTKLVASDACGVERRRMAITLLEPAVRARLAADLGTLAPTKTALPNAQEAAAGPGASKDRVELGKRLAAARWVRKHEQFSEGKLPPAVMGAEDARLADEQAAVDAARTALPPPPGPPRRSQRRTAVSALAHEVQATTDRELRLVLRCLESAVVGSESVLIAYAVGPFGVFLRPSAVPVARAAKPTRRKDHPQLHSFWKMSRHGLMRAPACCGWRRGRSRRSSRSRGRKARAR